LLVAFVLSILFDGIPVHLRDKLDESEQRLEQLRSAFLEQIADLPHDLFVTKYRNQAGTGLAPVEQEHYTVIYDGDTQSVLRLVLANEPEVGMLRRRLVFDLHDEAKATARLPHAHGKAVSRALW